jgi:hypothetical protein
MIVSRRFWRGLTLLARADMAASAASAAIAAGLLFWLTWHS